MAESNRAFSAASARTYRAHSAMRAKQSVPTTLLKCWTSEMRAKAEGSAQPPECVTLNACSTASGATSVGRVGTARIAPAALNAAASASVPAGAFGGSSWRRAPSSRGARRGSRCVGVSTNPSSTSSRDGVGTRGSTGSRRAPRSTRTPRRRGERGRRVGGWSFATFESFPSARALGDALARRSG